MYTGDEIHQHMHYIFREICVSISFKVSDKLSFAHYILYIVC